MIVDLVQVTTRDGVRLDGSQQTSPKKAAGPQAVDAILCVHGTGGSFYSSALFDTVSAWFLELGISVLRVNTRGHDLMSTAATSQGGRRQGAAYEVVDDCRHDLAAWTELLGVRGFCRIGLVGHSLGAVKCIYALAQETHASVACLIALSPPRLSYSHFAASSQGAEFLQAFTLAEQHVRAGQQGTLLDVTIPLPFVVTAGGYVEKYGIEERYNFLKFIARVPRPTFVTFGSLELESNMAFRGLPELLAPIAAAHGKMQVTVIPNADHFYSSTRSEVVARVQQWLQTVS